MLYYTHRLLPIYTEEIHQHRLRGLDCLFEQDNDPSHGTRTAENLAQYFLRSNWIEVFDHPPQSPDLSPIEGCWNILKQRIRKRYFDWHTVDEFRKVVLEEWDRITIKEIRARITELRIRYKAVIASNGFPYNSKLW
jgi:transposase